jgi:hypothetical protein
MCTQNAGRVGHRQRGSRLRLAALMASPLRERRRRNRSRWRGVGGAVHGDGACEPVASRRRARFGESRARVALRQSASPRPAHSMAAVVDVGEDDVESPLPATARCWSRAVDAGERSSGVRCLIRQRMRGGRAGTTIMLGSILSTASPTATRTSSRSPTLVVDTDRAYLRSADQLVARAARVRAVDAPPSRGIGAGRARLKGMHVSSTADGRESRSGPGSPSRLSWTVRLLAIDSGR